MSDVALFISRFPVYERQVRRRLGSDAAFRVVCEDYAEAVRALAAWEQDDAKAKEYGQLVRELEQELLGLLEAPEHARQQRRP